MATASTRESGAGFAAWSARVIACMCECCYPATALISSVRTVRAAVSNRTRFTIASRKDIAQVNAMNVGEAHRFFTQLKPAGAKDQVASLILDEFAADSVIWSASALNT